MPDFYARKHLFSKTGQVIREKNKKQFDLFLMQYGRDEHGKTRNDIR